MTRNVFMASLAFFFPLRRLSRPYRQLICLKLLCAAARKGRIAGNRRLRREVERHLARYPTRCRPWLFLDNHDLNRFLFECGGRRPLLDESVAFTGQWQCPSLTFYGTERAFANTKDIFDGTPYADERVRPCLREASVNVEP